MLLGLFDPDDSFDRLSAAELLHVVTSGVELLGFRARAMAALGRRTSADATLVSRLAEFAADPEMRSLRVFGTTSMAHLAIGGLIAGGSQSGSAAAKRLLEQWPEPDRSDLIWMLRSLRLEGRLSDLGGAP